LLWKNAVDIPASFHTEIELNEKKQLFFSCHLVSNDERIQETKQPIDLRLFATTTTLKQRHRDYFAMLIFICMSIASR
jgi:hypothetical protein